MTRALIAAAALLCAAPAMADDKGGTHSGLYAGVTGGVATSAITAEGLSIADTGAFGGAFVGFGQQLPSGVYAGIEIDGVLEDVQGSLSDSGIAVTAGSDWLASARVRLGQAFGPALLYGTAGLAITESKITAAGFGEDSQMLYGLAAGAGIELALTKTVTAGVEVMSYQFQPEMFQIGGVDFEADSSETVGRARLSFRLN